MKRPFAVAGIILLASSVFLLQTNEQCGTVIFSVLITISLAVFLLKKQSFLGGMLLITCVFTASALSVSYLTRCVYLPQKLLEGKTCYIEGIAQNFCEPYVSPKNFIVLKNCSVNGKNIKADIGVYFPSSFKCEYGDTVCAETTVYADVSKTPADHPDGVFLTAKATDLITVTPAARHSIVYFAQLTRIRLAEQITLSTIPDAAAIIKALILGDKSSLSSDFLAALKVSGTSHLFAVSGMHLSLWSGVAFLLLRRRARTKRYPHIVLSLFVLFYMALTGFSASVNRAGIMLLTVYAGSLFRKPADPLNSLGLAAFALLLKNPVTAVNVSFLLSFNATAAILLIFPLIEKRSSGRIRSATGAFRQLFLKILNIILLSLGVMLFTIPVSGEFFGTVSMLSPVSSVMCTLPVEALMLFAAAALCVLKIPWISGIFFTIASELALFTESVIHFLSRFDFAVCEVQAMPLLLWYAVTAVICAVVYYRGKKKTAKAVTALLICTGLLLPVGLLKNALTAKDIHIRIPACGTAGAILIHTDLGGTAALIINHEDSGSLFATAQYADRHIINNIDLLILPTGAKEDAGELLSGMLPLSTTGIVAASLHNGSRSAFSARLNDRILYETYDDPSLGLGALTCGQTRIIFCFYAGAQISDVPEDFLSGDILVCRSRIPKDIIPEHFEQIIVLSDRPTQASALPDNALSTADTDGITIRLKATEEHYALYF